MRGYVFTKEEKKILNVYINRGVKIRHFNVIMTLIRRNQENLKEDTEDTERRSPKDQKRSEETR